MAHGNEEAWAAELAAARSRSAEKTRVPLALRKKQNKEEIVHEMEQLKTHATAGDAEKASVSLRTLIRLRAKQFALLSEEARKKRGGMDQQEITKEIRAYYDDGEALKRLIETT